MIRNLNLENSLTFYGGGWNECDREFLNKLEPSFCSKIQSAEITEKEQTNKTTGEAFTSISICCHMIDRTDAYLNLSPKSTLNIGDKVDVASIVAIELEKSGEKNCVKYDAKAI